MQGTRREEAVLFSRLRGRSLGCRHGFGAFRPSILGKRRHPFPQTFERRRDQLARTIFQGIQIVDGQPLGFNGFVDFDARLAFDPEYPGIFGNGVTGAGNGDGQNGIPSFNGQTKCAIFERHDFPVARTGAFGKKHDAHAAVEIPFALRHGALGAFFFASTQSNVTGHAHHPAEARNFEIGFFRNPFHFPRQVTNRGNVGDGLVIGNDDKRSGTSRFLPPGHFDAPQGVEADEHGAADAEEPADNTADAIKRYRQDKQDRDEKRRYDDDRRNLEPVPKRNEFSFHDAAILIGKRRKKQVSDNIDAMREASKQAGYAGVTDL